MQSNAVRVSMTEKKKSEAFVKEYQEYFQMFCDCIANSTSFLADVQEKYKDDYAIILQFSDNPQSLEELVQKLPLDKQAILLRVLLKAGDFGRRFNKLMESTPAEKRQLAKDLQEFAKQLASM